MNDEDLPSSNTHYRQHNHMTINKQQFEETDIDCWYILRKIKSHAYRILKSAIFVTSLLGWCILERRCASFACDTTFDPLIIVGEH